MFGLGRRKDAQAVEAMREQLAAADMHARSVLAAVAQTDSRWQRDREDRARAQLSTAGALEQVRTSAVENAADISRALHQLTEMCGLVVERLEADGVERRALTEAINLLARQQSSPLETPSQVLGGMVLASDVPRNGDIARNGESPRNGDTSQNGNDAHVDEISLADYEDEPASPFGTVESFRPAEPFRAVEVVEVVEPVRTTGAHRNPAGRGVGRGPGAPSGTAPALLSRSRWRPRSRPSRSRPCRPRSSSRPRSSNRPERTTRSPAFRCSSPSSPRGCSSPSRPRRSSSPSRSLPPPSPRSRAVSTGNGTTVTGSPRRARFGPTAERG